MIVLDKWKVIVPSETFIKLFFIVWLSYSIEDVDFYTFALIFWSAYFAFLNIECMKWNFIVKSFPNGSELQETMIPQFLEEIALKASTQLMTNQNPMILPPSPISLCLTGEISEQILWLVHMWVEIKEKNKMHKPSIWIAT